MINVHHVGQLLASMGLRFDANETATFARQLEHIQAQTYDFEYPELKALQCVPLIGGVDVGANWFTFRGFDVFGKPKMIANGADDAPLVEVEGAEVSAPIRGYAQAYKYDLQELRNSAMAMRNLGGIGMPIDDRRAMACRDILARGNDSVIAVGEPLVTSPVPLTGFFNHPSVPVIQPVGSGGAIPVLPNGNWPSCTGAQILQDLNFIDAYIYTQTKGIYRPNALVLPPSLMGIVATKPASDLVPGVSVLDQFLKGSLWIKTVEDWYAAENAGATINTTNQRVVAYRKDPTCLGALLPLEFNQLPPEARNFAFIVNCESRVGGTIWFRPKSGLYIDGLGS